MDAAAAHRDLRHARSRPADQDTRRLGLRAAAPVDTTKSWHAGGASGASYPWSARRAASTDAAPAREWTIVVTGRCADRRLARNRAAGRRRDRPRRRWLPTATSGGRSLPPNQQSHRSRKFPTLAGTHSGPGSSEPRAQESEIWSGPSSIHVGVAGPAESPLRSWPPFERRVAAPLASDAGRWGPRRSQMSRTATVDVQAVRVQTARSLTDQN